jgi:O-antigen ligase
MSHSIPRNTPDRTPAALAWLLGAFVVCTTFTIAGTQTALGLIAALWLVLMAFGVAPRPRRTSLDIPVILFIAVSLAAALASKQKLASLQHLKNLPLFGVVYVLGVLVTGRRLGRRLYAALVFAGALSAAYGIGLHYLGLGGGDPERARGSFSTPMTFGSILLVLCSLSFAVVAGRGIARGLRIGLGVATVLMLAALLVSFTRSSWIGALVSVFIILALLRRRLIVLFAAALVALFLLLPPVYRERVQTMWSPTFGTNVQRLEMLSASWRMFKDHPVLGVGTMDLGDLYRQYKPPTAVFVHGHMHNNFVQIAVEMGLVGLAAFIFLLVGFYRLLARNLKLGLSPPERAFVVGSIGTLTGFLVNGLFDWNFGDAEAVTLLFVVIGANLAISLHKSGFQESGNGPVPSPEPAGSAAQDARE